MKSALLLVDLQNDYLATPGLLPAAPALVDTTASLLEACRHRRIPVIHIWTTIRREDDRRLPHWRRENRWTCLAGTAGHSPPSPLQPHEGEAVVHKTGFNAFADAALEQVLRQKNCDTVVVAGLHLHACVRTLAAECLERGCEVFIADDAVASNDPILAAATRRWLSERCVVFEPAKAILQRLDGVAPNPLLQHRSPRLTDQVLFEIPVADRNEIASAAIAAGDAAESWRRTPEAARMRPLQNLAAALDAMAPDLARQMAIEIGKPLAHGLEEVRRTAANLRDVAARAATDGRDTRNAAGLVRRRPLGVVAVISAWNNPVAIPLGKIAPALAYGNTVVWKPAPAGTQIARVLLKLLLEAGIPADAVGLVTGDHTTARALAANEHVNAVTLTGSLPAGYAVQEICARRMVPLQAELSGNNAAIVWDPVDFADAAAQAAWGAFAFAGQRCTANRRVIVSGSNFENLLRQLALAAEKLPWGDPLDDSTQIGPLITSSKRDEAAAQLAQAGSDDAVHQVLPLHAARAGQAWVKAGAYAQPAIVGCDRPDHPLVQEESMAPLLVVQRAEDFEHALELCNGVRHGLVAALFSRSPELQQRFLEAATAGVLKLNASTAGVDVTLPFGGWKASGIGPPEHGAGDVNFYTRMQAVYGATDSQ